MTAANPAMRTPTTLAPFYRRYELPWSPSEETERRFRAILRNLAIVFAIIAVLMPFLPRHVVVVNTDSLPERVVQLVMEPPSSSGLAAGSGSLRGFDTTQVKNPNMGATGQAATRAGGSGKASRSADEIAEIGEK